MGDELRRQVSALWLFHGATIERSLDLAENQLAVAEVSAFDPDAQSAAGEEREKVKAALAAFRELGVELQK